MVIPELEKILHRARPLNQLSIFLEKVQLFGMDDVVLVCMKQQHVSCEALLHRENHVYNLDGG